MTHSENGPPVVGESDDLAEALTSAAGLLVGFDFDGTLSPITEDPDEPTLPTSSEHPLRALVSQSDVRVAIVSGRELDDLRERVGISDVTYVGNHGLELYRDGEYTVQRVTERHQSSLRDVSRQLRAKVTEVPGSHIEDKGLTLTVHVRQTPPDHVEEVQDAVRAATSEKSNVRATTGKQVFEVRPAVDHDKGATMEMLASDVPADWLTLYLGDDTTDEDAFEAIQPEGIGIHVGTNTDTAAEYRIPKQPAVPAFLRWLTATVTENSEKENSEVKNKT